MKWELSEPCAGDMIRAKVGPLYHYGIYVSDSEVIQFGYSPALRAGTPDSQIRVCATDMETFLCGAFLEVGVPEGRERKKRYAPARTIALARERLGQTGYHILYNNCEHFAYECLTGEKRSLQTEGLRAMFRNMLFTDVYVAAVGDGPLGAVQPPLRQEQINSTTHEGLKRQRYYVWKLLEYALLHSYGLKLQDVHFFRDENGKWGCKECFFSLSHSRDAVAVAVSRQPVGVDIECLEHIVSDRLGDKILTQREQTDLAAAAPADRPGFLLEKWCAKESLYKAGTYRAFTPQHMETHTGVRTGTVRIGQEDHCYAVAARDLTRLRLYDNIVL